VLGFHLSDINDGSGGQRPGLDNTEQCEHRCAPMRTVTNSETGMLFLVQQDSLCRVSPLKAGGFSTRDNNSERYTQPGNNNSERYTHPGITAGRTPPGYNGRKDTTRVLTPVRGTNPGINTCERYQPGYNNGRRTPPGYNNGRRTPPGYVHHSEVPTRVCTPL